MNVNYNFSRSKYYLMLDNMAKKKKQYDSSIFKKNTCFCRIKLIITIK